MGEFGQSAAFGTRKVASSNLVFPIFLKGVIFLRKKMSYLGNHLGVGKLGNPLALEARERWFKSNRLDSYLSLTAGAGNSRPMGVRLVEPTGCYGRFDSSCLAP